MGGIMKEAFIIAREEPITLNDINNRYTHNERTCSSYINKNIDLTKSKDNYHFTKPTKSYLSLFKEMIENNVFSARKVPLNDKNTKIGSEIIIAVSADYLKTREEAIEFFNIANDFLNNYFSVTLSDGTVKNGKDLCLSSILHCDEKSYHLHYSTICCVASQIKKRRTKKEIAENKEPTILKEVVQLSHSRFWQSKKDEKGNLYYSYSQLNDKLFEWYQNAGYTDLKRGEKGSTAKHLHPLQYQQKMEELQTIADNEAKNITAKKIGNKYLLEKDDFENYQRLATAVLFQHKLISDTQAGQDNEKKKLAEEKKKIMIQKSYSEKAEYENFQKDKLISDMKQELSQLNQTIIKQENTIQSQYQIIDYWKKKCASFYVFVQKIKKELNTIIYNTNNITETKDALQNLNEHIDTTENDIIHQDKSLAQTDNFDFCI